MKSLYITSLALLTTFFSYAQTAKDFYNSGLENVKKINRVEAQKNFTEAIRKNSNYSEAYYQRGLIFNYFNETQSAKNDFEKVVSINNNLTKEAYNELAKIHFNERKYANALADYSKIIESDTTDHAIYLQRGKCNYYMKHFSRSEDDLNKSNNISPNAEAYFFLSLNQIEKKNWNKSEKLLNKAIELDDKNGQYYFYRGTVYFSKSEEPKDHHHHETLKKALEDFNKAIEMDEKLEEAYFERGEIKMELNDYVGAIADFQDAIKLTPTDLDAHFLKAMCNYHYGYEEQARKELQNILRKDPKFEDALYQLGRWELDLDNNQAAIEYFNRVIKINPTDPDARLFRAYARLELGDKGGACEDFKKADELGDKEAHKKAHQYCKK